MNRRPHATNRSNVAALVRRPLVVGIAVVALTPIALNAQTPGGPPEKFENLKFFPKDIPRDSLLGIMRGFTGALGVNCTYCHVTEPAPAGAPGPRERLKPASDDKETKKTADHPSHARGGR